MTYTYDAQGNLIRSVLEYYGYEQARSDHTYNNFDRLTEVRDNYGITEYTYDADGRRTSKTRNGVTEQYVWDGDQLVVKLGTERITQFTLSTSKGTDVRMPKLVEGQTYGLTVNGASYTAKAKKTVGEDDGPIQITRARPDDTEIPVLPPVTGKTRILLEFGPVSMEMEVNENPTTDGLVNVYVIGPANTAIALYDGDPALGTATYIRGLSLVAAVRDGARTYYHYNAHGDVVQLTNSSGTVTRNYTYDAFGVEQDASDSDANPFRYCGEQFDEETGNYYLRARYYSPEVGRFTQEDTHWNPGNMIYGDEPQKWNEWQGEEDPLGLHAYTYKLEATAVAQTGNLYAYGLNNPILYRDSTGNFVVTAIVVGILVGAAVGGAVGAGISYSKYGEVRWQFVAGGAVVGAVIGGLVGYGIGSVLGVASGSKVATSAVSKALSSATAKKIGHVVVAKHHWELVTSKVNWESVQKVIQKVIMYGETKLLNTTQEGGLVFEAVKTINGHQVKATYTVIEGIVKLGDAWVVTR